MNIKKIKTKAMIAIMLSFLIVFQTFMPTLAMANQVRVSGALTEIRFTDRFTVNGDYHRLFDGRSPGWNGWKELFCLEKDIDIGADDNTNHQFNNPKNIPHRVQLISALWKDAIGGSISESDARIVTQVMIWDYLKQVNDVTSLYRENGSTINYSSIASAINRLVDAYEIKPNFADTTINLRVGESVVLTDANGVLSEYVNLISNTANVDITKSGNRLTITAKANSNLTGVIRYTKDEKHGTPLLLTSPTHQNAMVAGIDDPANFRLNINVIREGQVKLTKHDSETEEKAQGDATLVGAKYGIYSNAAATNLIEELTIGSDLTATSKRFDINSGRTVYIKETQAPLGYNLDTTIYPVQVNPVGNTAEVVLRNFTVKDREIKGDVAIHKYYKETETSSSQLVPEKDAGFSVYLNRTNQQVGGERFTDEDGYVRFSDLPYGRYTVKQTTVPSGMLKVDDFQVFVNEDGRTYNYSILNGIFESLVKIVKTDSETGKSILAADTAFKVKDLQKDEFITQTINYPTPIQVDEFKTNEYGELVLPLPLRYGKYAVYELIAPNGYVLDRTPLEFKVSEDMQDGEMIVVEFANKPQKGVVNLNKTGEMLSGVEKEKTEFGDKHNFIYEQKLLKGAVFDIVADEDIVTLDGTVRAEAGEVVATVTTGVDGEVKSSELYLGKYHAVEVEVEAGYVLTNEKLHFELMYAGEEIELTSMNIDAKNKLQEIDINVNKVAEVVTNRDEDSRKILETEYRHLEGIVFGIFAREDIVLNEGTVQDDENLVKEEVIVPADGLVGLSETGAEGVAKFQSKYPEAKFYVKEIATTSKHVLLEDEWDFDLRYEDNNSSLAVNVWQEGVFVGKQNLNRMTRTPLKNDLSERKVDIKTRAHTDDNTQYFTHGDVVNMYDNVDITHDMILDGTERSFEAILVALLPDGTMKDIWSSGKIDYVVSDKEFAKQVVTKVDTSKYPEGTQFFFKERAFDEDGEEDARHNFDGKDQNQGIYPKEPVVPEKPEPKPKKPNTGDFNYLGVAGIILGLSLMVLSWQVWLMRARKREQS